jgi:hypothetical protein
MGKARAVSTPYPAAAELKINDEEDDELPAAQVHQYHSAIGKLMWVLQERPDLSFAVKELSRSVQHPMGRHWGALKRLLRYLRGTKTMELYLEIDGEMDDQIHVVTDANWATGEGRKSTSGGTVWMRGFLLGHWCRTQPTIALSTCEAELVAMSTGVVEAKLAQTLCKELTLDRQLHLHSDSAAGIASVSKRGFGRLRHLDIKQLWLQEEVRAGRLHVHHVNSADNVSDVLTKALAGQIFAHLKEMIGVRMPKSEEKKVDEVAMLSQHPPPRCSCSTLMWIHVSASGIATWRCPTCRNEISWSLYLRRQAELLVGRHGNSEGSYSTGMFAPSPYVEEPAAEPQVSRPEAMPASSSRPRSPPPVQSAPTLRQVDYLAALAQRLGLDVDQELRAVRTKAQASAAITRLLARLEQRNQPHPPPTRG